VSQDLDVEVARLRAENARLAKVIAALVRRAEHEPGAHESGFDRFHSAVVLEDKVQQRTHELGAALHQVEDLQEELRHQALRDALTGLYNRRYLHETLPLEIARAERAGASIGFVMCDIDHFKRVNDEYGHPAGDEVLKAFAALLQRRARASDVHCRYGGEEFLLVLPGASAAATCARAEQIRADFERLSVTSGAAEIRATASFAVAAYPVDGTSAEALVGAADRALYAAKASGRNRVERAGPA
jgi:diguanylate cyclase (GGDEF)-like protein